MKHKIGELRINGKAIKFIVLGIKPTGEYTTLQLIDTYNEKNNPVIVAEVEMKTAMLSGLDKIIEKKGAKK